jgi:ankyrin repeat protein
MGQTPAFVACIVRERSKFWDANSNGSTPLSVLMQNGNRELATKLLASGHFGNVNIASELQEIPLHLAIIHNFPSAADRLLFHGAETDLGGPKDGLLPIHLACELDHYERLVPLTKCRGNICV